MKALAAIAALTVASALTATSASASSFHPKDSFFSFEGPVAITKNSMILNCTMKINMQTDSNGNAIITSASISPISPIPTIPPNICNSFGSRNLPWQVSPIYPSTLNINNAMFSFIVPCSATSIPVAILSNGLYIDQIMSSCNIKGFLTGTQPIIILYP